MFLCQSFDVALFHYRDHSSVRDHGLVSHTCINFLKGIQIKMMLYQENDSSEEVRKAGGSCQQIARPPHLLHTQSASTGFYGMVLPTLPSS